MTEDTAQPASFTPTATSEPVIPAGYLCYRCSYDLGGLPTDGECPECSTRYSFALAFRGKPHPGQLQLMLRIAWPSLLGLGVLAAAIVLQLLGPRGTAGNLTGLLACTVVLLSVVNLLYVPITSSSMTTQFVPPHRRRSWAANMWFLGPLVAVGWWLGVVCILLPVAALAITALMGIVRGFA